MKKIIYTFLFCCLFSLQSCLMKREHMYHFTKQDSLCFDIYDTLKCYTFKTNKGTDTLIIKDKHLEEEYNEWYWDQVDGSTFEAFFNYKGIIIHHGKEEGFFVSYSKDTLNHDPIMTVELATRLGIDIQDKRNLVKQRIYRDTIIVDSANSVLTFKEEEHNFTCKYLIWHKYEGIIGYELSDGTIYKKNGITETNSVNGKDR